MRKSLKFFLASIIVFACSVGFFLGALSFGNNDKAASEVTVSAEKNPVKANKKHHKEKPSFKSESAFMDSVLQITSEQKVALEKQRIFMDSSFKTLYKQKKHAEKSLSKALIEKDSLNIALARENILKAQEAMLDLRIAGVKNWNKILTKEQIEKFKQLKQERKKKFKKHWKKHHKPETDASKDESDDSADSTSSESTPNAE